MLFYHYNYQYEVSGFTLQDELLKAHHKQKYGELWRARAIARPKRKGLNQGEESTGEAIRDFYLHQP